MVPIVLGIYESSKSEKVGTGATKQERELRIYWFAAQIPGGDIACQPLNDVRLPSGFVQKVDKEAFFSEYTLSPQLYDEYMRSVVNSLRDKLNSMDPIGELPELSREEGMVLRGLTALLHVKPTLQLSETDLLAVRTMLDSMRQTNEVVLEYQRAITSVAIDLRKQRKFPLAVEYYKKVLALDARNDHLMFNLARVYFEMGQLDEARELLLQAIEINPELDMARRFLRYLDASGQG